MPPAENEVYDVQPELLKDEFEREEREERKRKMLAGEPLDDEDPATREAAKEMKLFMFILRHRAFFRLFVNQLSPENKIRELWDRVANGPRRALEALEVDQAQYQFRDEAEGYFAQSDPETYTAFTEALEELEGQYEEFSADLKTYIAQTDPEAYTALINAFENDDNDAADKIIETFGHMRERTQE